MNQFKEMLENQQKVNNAIKSITDYFGDECPYSAHVEQMADAQIEILKLLELADIQITTNPSNRGYISHEELVLFLQDVRQYLKLLKPFAELANGLKQEA